MSMPDFLSRTLQNNAEFARRARPAAAKPGPVPPMADIVRILDAAINTGNFYGVAAQDAYAGLVDLRDRMVAVIGDHP